MHVTIDDVAREAGVSIATVSRFMNGHYGSMSKQTRDRLQTVVERLGYMPNPVAQALKTGRSYLIGVVLANIAHPYWSSVLAGVEEACQSLGYSVMISSARDSVELESHYLRVFLNHKADGLILNPAAANPETIARWSSLTCPVILLDRTLPGLRFDLVAMDNVHGARLAVEHLVEMGHRRIGLISWETKNLSNREERLRGYRDALEAHGIEVDERRIRFVEDNSWSDGVEKTISLFKGAKSPTAVFSASSLLNLQVLAGLKQLGLQVPEDVSVVGYDESPWDALLDPPLTTVATPAHQLGVAAAKHLIRLIEEGGRSEARQVRLKPKLVARTSTREI